MTQKTLQNIKSILFALAIVLGTSYASAVWTPAPANPPASNVPAPINAGGGTVGNIYSQFKTGLLTLDHLITGDLTVASLTPITIGQVLTAVGTDGKVGWGTVAGGGNCTPGASGADVFSTIGTHEWKVPDGVTSARVKLWGGGGDGGSGRFTRLGQAPGGGGGGGGGYGEILIQIPAGTEKYSVVLQGSDGQTRFGDIAVGSGRKGANASFSGGLGGAGGLGLVGGLSSQSGTNGQSGTGGGIMTGMPEFKQSAEQLAPGVGGAGGSSFPPNFGGGGNGGNGARGSLVNNDTATSGIAHPGAQGSPGRVVVEYTGGGNCTGGTGTTGVSKITAGTGISVTPASGTGDVTVSASGSNLVDTVAYTMNTRVTRNEKNHFSISMDGVNIATGHYGGTDSQGDLTDVFIMNFTFNKVTGMFSYALDSNQIGPGNSGSINIVNSEFSVNTNPLANAKTYFYAKYNSSTKRLTLTYQTGYNSSFSVFANKFAR